ncbi:disintegrin and metalloproteinase domain-containing protein 21-like [Anolis carolinensis]|uniref:disintegrin and metalloproteinase domain-containing protein 21-like n=1 Tax=Anolis carolinensis TaxID=28377 RepID=UPI0007DB7A78|nr:PREDICTED: disintegrin and metalloproteinase domain-containing protein 21-like [Anolis carolinensis]|eukprot:XP_016851920.1 PREDICTED: disintegrin and metalloproteinase domain-containing protein 21-like [Anolis carolinensis]
MVNSSAWLPLLILWNVPREAECLKPPQSAKYASYEVTIPRRVMPRHGQATPEVTYHLQIEGKGHMMHLREKRGYVPQNFPVFSYSKQGELQVDYPFIRRNCFYQGYIEGKPSSLVTVSTCSGGFRGLFQLENKTYEIEPVQASPTFQHIVYRLEEKEIDSNVKCGLTEEEQNRQMAMLRNSGNLANKSISGRSWWMDVRYVEIAIVVEYDRYVDLERNETLISLLFLDLVHGVNSRFDPLSVQLTLIGLEIWSQRNLIRITDNIGQTLTTFSLWRRDALLLHLENDVAYLFAYRYFQGMAGLASLGSVCDAEKGAGIISFFTYSFSEYSMVFAHELGHNLGMRHDGRQCDCDRSVCIMTEVLTNGYRFSNCSQNDYYNMMNQHCLFFPPDPDKAYRRRYCGNKIVEDGEQCDCGTKQQCQTDLCCQPDCKLRKDVICAFGDCCVNCNYIPAQVPCRKNVSVCDLPEYCNGSSQWCPADVYVQDGAPCGEGLHCYHGRCILPNEQCKMMFGIRSTAASEGCFRNVNSKGDRFGNCGFRNGTYIKCKQRHVMCGRMQCERINDLALLEEHTTLVHTDTGNRECWGLDYHTGMNLTDIGDVRDGTPCGPDRLCINQQCETVASLNYDCDFNQCFNRGICNNLKHCHCDYGWAPPKCFNKGFGGSVDSGPPPRQKRRLIMSSKAKLFSYIFLPVVAIITCFIIVFRNDLIYLYTRLKERLQARRKKHAERFRRRKDLTAIQMRMMQNA